MVSLTHWANPFTISQSKFAIAIMPHDRATLMASLRSVLGVDSNELFAI